MSPGEMGTPMKKLIFAVAAMAATAGVASAALPNYPAPGTENPVLYSFTAASDGDILAYFALNNVTAFNDEDLGLRVNGVDTAINGLENHSTSAGTSLNFGHVNAGDALDFYIRVFNSGDVFHSDRALNADGVNHVWATAYAGGDFGIPAGTYVGFEDVFGGGDHNYRDEAFIFTNVAGAPGAPEPASWALMILGFGAVGSVLRRRRGAVAV